MSPAHPRISLLTRATSPAALEATIESLRAQRRRDWELIVCGHDDNATLPRDYRIRRCHDSLATAATDAALGEFVTVIDAGDTIPPTALERIAAAIRELPDTDLLYTDESIAGQPDGAAMRVSKPEWSPERLRHGDYLGRLVLQRTAALRDVGGLRSGFGDAVEFDAALRVSEVARRVTHLPEALYERHKRPSQSGDSGRRAVAEHLARQGIRAAVEPGAGGWYRLQRQLDPAVTVSIILPTRGQHGPAWDADRCYVIECVRSARRMTEHANLEFVVVYDAETPDEVLAQLREVGGDQLVLVPYAAPFNFSEKCNIGFLHARGDVIVLLNDDTEAVSPGWLERLVAPLAEPTVGICGAKLLYPDGTLQHAGHVYAPKRGERTLHHAYHRHRPDTLGALGDLVINRECSGVTAACAALRRDVYERVGGFSQLLPGNYNDVDLCLKIRHLGLRVLWIADCELVHFESRSRDRRVHKAELDFIAKRWGSFTRDPFTPTDP